MMTSRMGVTQHAGLLKYCIMQCMCVREIWLQAPKLIINRRSERYHTQHTHTRTHARLLIWLPLAASQWQQNHMGWAHAHTHHCILFKWCMDVCASDVCVCVRLGVRLCCAVKDFRKCGYFKKTGLFGMRGDFWKWEQTLLWKIGTYS